MSNSLGSSFQSNTFNNQTNQPPANLSWNVITTPSQFVVSTPSSMAHLSSNYKPTYGMNQTTSNQPEASTSAPKKPAKKKLRKFDDEDVSKNTAARFATSIALDQLSALYPDVETPFEDVYDVVNRLLPYHVFQHPKSDPDVLKRGNPVKGKGKALDCDMEIDIKETKFALECIKRRKDLETRFRRVRVKSGTHASPSDQAYVLAQAVLEADRTANLALSNELRSARAEKDKLDREKRAASVQTPRSATYSTFSQTQYYRGYPYSYPQPYSGAPSQPATPMSVYPTPAASFTNYQPSTASVPVQIPVGSLPALQALGIVPVPASSLPPADQPQPLAVLRGSTSNGTMLSLEINVSLLQSAQMNGLALVLNSLMSRGGDPSTAANLLGATGAGAT